ncbi:kinase-like domain-containing protein [Syncephalastrum racemosum]|uniref:Kinase-like domain-containing protein n=1 Tax=Syncephalastrum racemosum TaxID=13706 RepID=A0A1X2HH69_SYNRA|nr:kinase-like domain-containing protein [Syncephalastrum racemosum]
MLGQLKSLLRRSSNNVQVTAPQSPPLSSPKQEEPKRTNHKRRLPQYAGLDRYKLVAKLGDGAFSKVYKAIDIDQDTVVAVKVIRKTQLSQNQRAGVLKEVQLMRTINEHPSIVKLHRFIDTTDHYFLILEMCEGGELFHRIVQLTYLSEDLSRHCIRQVAEGIRYLHEEKGIVHRDIKPENLLFEPIPFMERVSPAPPQQPMDGDEPKEDEGEFVPGLGGGGIGRVKIADFGLSKVVWDQQTMTPCGTVGYTAPEIVRDERYSKSVDMWALGCVLYTLLCGFPPFYDESVQVLTEKVARGQYTFLSPWWDTVSAEAKDLISHLLCVDSAERYTIDQFFEHPWMNDQKGKEQSSSPTPQQQPQSPPIAMPSSAPKNIPQSDKPQKRRDLFSPDITSMKEMFDVSYAVKRITEEQNKTASPTRAMFGNALNGDDDHEADERLLDQRLRRANHNNDSSNNMHPRLPNEENDETEAVSQQLAQTSLVAPPPSQEESEKLLLKSKERSKKPLFELSMDNATLLGRRGAGGLGKKGPQG